MFAKDSDRLRPGARERLDRLARQLRSQGPGKVAITGYTDDLGSAAHGLDLSRRRATRVADVLRDHLPQHDYPFTVHGLGEDNPAVPNTSEANRRKNRRVAVLLTRALQTPVSAALQPRPSSALRAPAPIPSPNTTSPAPASPAPTDASSEASPTVSAAAEPPPPTTPSGHGWWPAGAGLAATLVLAGGAVDLLLRRRRRDAHPDQDDTAAGGSTPPGAPATNGSGTAPPSREAPTQPTTPDLAWASPILAVEHHSTEESTTSTPATTVQPAQQVAGDAERRSRPPTGDQARTQRLDADLAAWWDPSTRQPRLSLLGPVRARTTGQALARRKPYYTELLAYLTLRPHGATADEVADAFGLTTARVRTDMKVLRDWLGTNPNTDRPYLPDARDSRAARQRGIAVYQVDDVLCDWQLFQHLRDRAARAQQDVKISYLEQSLKLVTGRPFDQVRPAGWNWALTHDCLDHHVTLAIADVAQTLARMHCENGDLDAATQAARVANLSTPYDTACQNLEGLHTSSSS